MTNSINQTQDENIYRLELSTIDGTYFFDPKHIIRMEASNSYTYVYFTNRKPMLISKVLKAFEKILQPYGFLRTHRSHLVNRKYIAFVTNSGSLLMDDSSKAEISRRKRVEVFKILKNRIVINMDKMATKSVA